MPGIESQTAFDLTQERFPDKILPNVDVEGEKLRHQLDDGAPDLIPAVPERVPA